jgi:aromatic-amino-acid transaminase
MKSSPFATVPLAPKDPILGITEQFLADPRPSKVNLGVGVYYDGDGKLPLLKSVQHAEETLAEAHGARGYLPIDGIAPYNKRSKACCLAPIRRYWRKEGLLTVQALGGTGALRIGADLLKRFSADSPVYISDPSWENHRALFEASGFAVKQYPYYDPGTHAVKLEDDAAGAL